MLVQMFLLACISDPVVDDTAVAPVPDPGATWSPRVPGPYDQLCENYPRDPDRDDNRNGTSDMEEFQSAGINEALFHHSAQVLQAKFADYLGASAPDLPAVCNELYNQLLFTPDYDIPAPPIGDCPNLFPASPGAMPPQLAQYYTFGSGNLLTWAEFTNIYIFQWRMTKAMDQTENVLAPLPGCWLEFGLKGAAKDGLPPEQVSLNTMPAILFAMENYGTAAVVYTDDININPEGSMVISGADYTLPSPVWNYLNGGPTPAGVTPYHLTFLLSGYPADSSFVLNIDAVDVSVFDVISAGSPPNILPPFTGNGIIDPETEQQLRELDWFISQSVAECAAAGTGAACVTVDTDPSTLDLSHSAEFTAAGPGTGFPKLWPN
jgi:hypothetical protein